MRSSTLIIIILLMVGTLSLVAYGERGMIHAKLNDLKLIPIPERFTELYFEDPSSLPTQTTAGKPISFAFGVHNVEGTPTTYPYVVYFDEPAGYSMNLQTGTISLAPDASKNIPISYTFLASKITGKVVVDLPSVNQHIDFLLLNK